MLENNPQFREQWERMSPEEQQKALRSLEQGMNNPEFQDSLVLLQTFMQYSLVFSIVGLLVYAMWAWFMAKICAPMGVGSFVEFLVPFWNMYLLIKAADCSPWTFLLFFLPLINLFFMFHLYGKIAERLGMSYAGWGLLLLLGNFFAWALIGLYPYYLLGKHAQASMRQGLPEEYKPVI